MQAQANFLFALAKGVWAMNGSVANELTPLADRVLAGEPIQLLQAHATPLDPQVKSMVHVATMGPALGGGPRPFRMGYYTDLDKVEPGSIAVISIQGVILKQGMCGIGSMERAQRILEAGQHPNVAAILLDTDTPGGQVSGLNTVWDAIWQARQIKPVIGFINDGGCYSAGYHNLSPCTEIWASHSTCGVGSIGTMCQFTDYTEADKKAGNKRLAVYATKSTDKNATFREALAGNLAPLIAELDVLNDDFHARILRSRRAKIKNPAAVFTGKTFSATQGVQLGLIDTIGSMQQCLAHCAELAKVPAPALPAEQGDDLVLDSPDDDATSAQEVPATPPTPTETPAAAAAPAIISSLPNMKQYPMFAALIGLAAKDFNSTAEGAHLQPAHLDAVEAALMKGTQDANALATATTERNTAQASLTAAQGELTTAKADVTAKAGEVTALQARLATAPAATAAPKPGQEVPAAGAEKTPEANEWDAMDKAALDNLREEQARYAL